MTLWAYRYAVSRDALEMGPQDRIEIAPDAELDALVFSIQTRGREDGLARTFDRLIWALQAARAKMQEHAPHL